MRITIRPDAPVFQGHTDLKGKTIEATPRGNTFVFLFNNATYTVPKEWIDEAKPIGRPPKSRE